MRSTTMKTINFQDRIIMIFKSGSNLAQVYKPSKILQNNEQVAFIYSPSCQASLPVANSIYPQTNPLNTTLSKMHFLNLATLLAVLTFGSVVSALPPARKTVKTSFDPTVTYEVCPINHIII